MVHLDNLLSYSYDIPNSKVFLFLHSIGLCHKLVPVLLLRRQKRQVLLLHLCLLHRSTHNHLPLPHIFRFRQLMGIVLLLLHPTDHLLQQIVQFPEPVHQYHLLLQQSLSSVRYILVLMTIYNFDQQNSL